MTEVRDRTVTPAGLYADVLGTAVSTPTVNPIFYGGEQLDPDKVTQHEAIFASEVPAKFLQKNYFGDEATRRRRPDKTERRKSGLLRTFWYYVIDQNPDQ